MTRISLRLFRLSTPPLLFLLALIVVGLCVGLEGPQVARAQEPEKTKAYFQAALAEFSGLFPGPPPCIAGFSASRNRYVTNLSDWAADAGLRRGDRIESIAGVPIGSEKEWAGAYYKVPANGPMIVGVRRGGRTLTLALPCRDGTESWRIARGILNAAANGNWTECLDHVTQSSRLRGFVTAAEVDARYRCLIAQNRALNRPDASTEMSLLYERNLLQLREGRYVPGALDMIRGGILNDIALLRKYGFASLATDLEAQLQKAGEEEASAQRPSSPAPERVTTQGTAFVVRPDGGLLTAFHVVQGGRDIRVACPDSQAMPATVETVASSNDLVVLRIAHPTPYYLSLATPRSLKVGDPVFTIGFPATAILGTEPKFTEGSVSALSGPGGEATFIQMSVPIQPGNSGGALLSNVGRVVGIVTSTAAIRPFISETGTLPQNINWAVKSAYAIPLFDPPAGQPEAKSRTEAINRAMKATCMIEVEQ